MWGSRAVENEVSSQRSSQGNKLPLGPPAPPLRSLLPGLEAGGRLLVHVLPNQALVDCSGQQGHSAEPQ